MVFYNQYQCKKKKNKKNKTGIHLIKAVPFCQSLGSLVAIYNTAWSCDIIIVHCLIFRLHYMLLQRFRSRAESERKPFPPDQYLWLYYLSASTALTQTVLMVLGQRERERSGSLSEGETCLSVLLWTPTHKIYTCFEHYFLLHTVQDPEKGFTVLINWCSMSKAVQVFLLHKGNN